jgi:hypothetical protein
MSNTIETLRRFKWTVSDSRDSASIEGVMFQDPNEEVVGDVLAALYRARTCPALWRPFAIAGLLKDESNGGDEPCPGWQVDHYSIEAEYGDDGSVVFTLEDERDEEPDADLEADDDEPADRRVLTEPLRFTIEDFMAAHPEVAKTMRLTSTEESP